MHNVRWGKLKRMGHGPRSSPCPTRGRSQFEGVVHSLEIDSGGTESLLVASIGATRECD